MNALTITLEGPIKFRLQEQAAMHGCTAEEEAKSILEKFLAPEPHPQGIGTRIHQLFQKIGGVELDLPIRSLPRLPQQDSDAS